MERRWRAEEDQEGSGVGVGSTLSAFFRVVGVHFERMRDDVLEWPSVWVSRRSLFERATARWSRRLSPMEWKRAIA